MLPLNKEDNKINTITGNTKDTTFDLFMFHGIEWCYHCSLLFFAPQITQLKIDHNPFAKGFRDNYDT